MEPVIGSARLFDAFEHMGQSPGADMRSPWGPSGMPSADVQHAFQEAMQPPAQVEAAGTNENQVTNFNPAQDAPGMERVENLHVPAPEAPGPAQFIAGPQGPEATPRVDGVSRAESPDLGQLDAFAEHLGGGTPTPVELYQIQYQVGMLRANLSILLKSSQSLGQSLETTLKQSG